jgi:PEP-CTERM motif
MGIRAGWLVVVVGLMASSAAATPLTVAYTDTSGRQWASLIGTTGLTWNQIAGVCATNGVTACTADVGAVGLTGWTWATRNETRDVFIDRTFPSLSHANFDDFSESLANSAFAPQLISTFGITFAGSVNNVLQALTSTLFSPNSAYVATVNDRFDPSVLDVADLASNLDVTTSSPTVGAMLFRTQSPSDVPEPATLTLVGLGVMGLASRRRRRN